MTNEGDRPPETPDNFARTPDRDPDASIEERGDLPEGWGPNQTLVWVMIVGAVLAVLLGAIFLYAI